MKSRTFRRNRNRKIKKSRKYRGGALSEMEINALNTQYNGRPLPTLAELREFYDTHRDVLTSPVWEIREYITTKFGTQGVLARPGAEPIFEQA